MAGDDDRDRVAAVGQPDGAGGAGGVDAPGDLAVGGGLAVGDRSQLAQTRCSNGLPRMSSGRSNRCARRRSTRAAARWPRPAPGRSRFSGPGSAFRCSATSDAVLAPPGAAGRRGSRRRWRSCPMERYAGFRREFDLDSESEMEEATRDRLLDAAERLFAEHGYQATTMRGLTSEAEANIAAVNYHFGCKQSLLEAVVHRALAPVVDGAAAAAGRRSGEDPSVEEVVEAIVGPLFECAEAAPLLGRLFVDPDPEMRCLVRAELAESSCQRMAVLAARAARRPARGAVAAAARHVRRRRRAPHGHVRRVRAAAARDVPRRRPAGTRDAPEHRPARRRWCIVPGSCRNKRLNEHRARLLRASPPDRRRGAPAGAARSSAATSRPRTGSCAATCGSWPRVARRHVGRGLAMEDLLQEGVVGLIRAAEKYDWRRGTRFSTYAVPWIRQSIAQALANTGRLIRLPGAAAPAGREARAGRARAAGARRARRRRRPSWPRPPGCRRRRCERIKRADTPAASLDAPVGDGAGRLVRSGGRLARAGRRRAGRRAAARGAPARSSAWRAATAT